MFGIRRATKEFCATLREILDENSRLKEENEILQTENVELRNLFYEAWEWMQRARYDRSIRANEMDEIGVKAVKMGFPDYELGIETGE